MRDSVLWCRYPFEGEEDYAMLRSEVVRLGLEVAAVIYPNSVSTDWQDELAASVSWRTYTVRSEFFYSEIVHLVSLRVFHLLICIHVTGL